MVCSKNILEGSLTKSWILEYMLMLIMEQLGNHCNLPARVKTLSTSLHMPPQVSALSVGLNSRPSRTRQCEKFPSGAPSLLVRLLGYDTNTNYSKKLLRKASYQTLNHAGDIMKSLYLRKIVIVLYSLETHGYKNTKQQMFEGLRECWSLDGNLYMLN